MYKKYSALLIITLAQLTCLTSWPGMPAGYIVGQPPKSLDGIEKALVRGDEKRVKEFIARYPAERVAEHLDHHNALHTAAFVGRVAIAQLLLERGASLNLLHGTFGNSPLHIAIAERRVSMVDFLITQGADTSKKKREGDTPLAWAEKWLRVEQDFSSEVRQERHEIIKLLLTAKHSRDDASAPSEGSSLEGCALYITPLP